MIGKTIHALATELWDIDRSLTGDGVRKTLDILRGILPDLEIKSVPSGTKVFDWEVPKEWRVNDAYIIDPNGRKFCNFSANNLHLVGYSIPYNGTMSLEQLQEHLYSLPDQPDAIPYVTSYYKERWGFCISQLERDQLIPGDYTVVIKTELFNGVLNYAELKIPGERSEEVFVSTYICHPSMANNELSGPTVSTYLAKWLQEQDSLRQTYRFVFVPETIGSIAYLSSNHLELKQRVIAGFNVTCVGDNRAYSYLPSRNGGTLSDRVAKHVLGWTDPNYVTYKWTDRGSDERQYCAPGIDLPIASIMRTKYGNYPEYHTSLDNLTDVVTAEGLEGGYWALRRSLELIEKNHRYTANVLCEPQMGKRGLYPTLSTKESNKSIRMMMDFLSYCDGAHDIIEIADLLNVPAWDLYEAAKVLVDGELISAETR